MLGIFKNVYANKYVKKDKNRIFKPKTKNFFNVFLFTSCHRVPLICSSLKKKLLRK